MTVRDLIKKSLLEIGAISAGENIAASEADDGLSTINQLLGSWSAEGMMIYQNVRESFSLVANQASYTIGSGGDFNTTNPQRITQASIIDTNSNPNVEYQLRIDSTQEYASIPDKTLTTSIPTDLYFRRGVTTSTVVLYPAPNSNKQVVLYSIKPFSSFATVNDSISLPHGYERALRLNLALELAPQYGKEPSPIIIKNASESKLHLKRTNYDAILLKSDILGLTSGDRRSFNIFRGE